MSKGNRSIDPDAQTFLFFLEWKKKHAKFVCKMLLFERRRRRRRHSDLPQKFAVYCRHIHAEKGRSARVARWIIFTINFILQGCVFEPNFFFPKINAINIYWQILKNIFYFSKYWNLIDIIAKENNLNARKDIINILILIQENIK